MAIVTWGEGYFSNCLNEPGMDRFLEMYYRQAWEDYPPGGTYDYLYMGGSPTETLYEADGSSYIEGCPNAAAVEEEQRNDETPDFSRGPFDFPDSASSKNVASLILFYVALSGFLLLALDGNLL
jgi:hypothetical protein